MLKMRAILVSFAVVNHLFSPANRNTVQERTFSVDFYKIKFMDLPSLIQTMISATRSERFEPIVQHTLTVDYSVSNIGGFKTAYFGTIEPSPFHQTGDVCAKQAHNDKGIKPLLQVDVQTLINL